MIRHYTIIEVGPGVIRRLCCGTGLVATDDPSEEVREALGAIDDPVALVGGRPVAVDALWRAALRSVRCGQPGGLAVVHPSWWPPTRVDLVTAAARALGGGVVTRPRSWLLRRAADGDAVVVEIAERLVAITGAEVTALPRGADPDTHDGHDTDADEVTRVIAGMTHTTAVVVIDAPSAVAGAPALASSLAAAVRRSGRAVVEVSDARLAVLARSALPVPDAPSTSRVDTGRVRRRRARSARALAGAAVALTVLPLAISAVTPARRHGPPAPVAVPTAPTAFLVEGRVAMTVPGDWPAQRIVTGPGSARVLLTSPSDPEAALHVTQSPVAGETLSGTAERLQRAIEAAPAGIFVDFDPAASSAGRPAVTYREVRATHHVRWTVLLDGPVRISIGCQSRPGGDAAVRAACEQAVRTAHAIG